MNWFSVFLLLLIHTTFAYADRASSPSSGGPWTTGPLLTPSAKVVPLGHVNAEPYIFTTAVQGFYNSNWQVEKDNHFSINLLALVQFGITSFMDFQINPGVVNNKAEGASSTRFNDLPFFLGFRLLEEDLDGWTPNIKFMIRENLPTGKYQKLNPNKRGTDSSGSGAWSTAPGLLFSKQYHLGGRHFFIPRASIFYTMAPPIPVKGFNTYGGGFGTEGKVRPGHILTTTIAFEYTLTQRWVLALDVVNAYSAATKFSGKAGTTAYGTPATVGNGSSEQLSLAPALEYNWNANIGVIAGCWFTVAGRNAEDFTSGVIALNIYY